MQETRVRQKPNPEEIARRKAALKEPSPMNFLKLPKTKQIYATFLNGVKQQSIGITISVYGANAAESILKITDQHCTTIIK